MTTQTATQTTQTTQTAQFRRGQRGQWVVYGPAPVLASMTRVPVAKRDGSVTAVTLRRVSPATTPGMAWGEILEQASTSASSPRRDPRCKDPMGDGYVHCLCRDCR